MCEHGDTVDLVVAVPAHLSHTGKARRATISIDRCITSLIEALNKAGVLTVASCCGHGNRPGNIALTDGRELVIAADWDQGRRVDACFLSIHGDDPRSLHVLESPCLNGWQSKEPCNWTGGCYCTRDADHPGRCKCACEATHAPSRTEDS